MIDGKGDGFFCKFLYSPMLVIQNGQLLKDKTLI